MGRTFGSNSLCWCCKKAAASLKKSCIWAQFKKPIEGWNVDHYANSRGRVNVITCPEFEPDDCIVEAITYCKTLCLEDKQFYRTFANQLAELDYDPIRKESVDYIVEKCEKYTSVFHDAFNSNAPSMRVAVS